MSRLAAAASDAAPGSWPEVRAPGRRRRGRGRRAARAHDSGAVAARSTPSPPARSGSLRSRPPSSPPRSEVPPMNPRSTTLIHVLCAAAALADAALADEGRIPIHAASVITQPGVYLVTRDFSAPQPLTIQASDVTVDLGGHTVTCTMDQA